MTVSYVLMEFFFKHFLNVVAEAVILLSKKVYLGVLYSKKHINSQKMQAWTFL